MASCRLFDVPLIMASLPFRRSRDDLNKLLPLGVQRLSSAQRHWVLAFTGTTILEFGSL